MNIRETHGLAECAIVGHGLARATLDGITHLRRDPGPGRPKTLDYQILKYADEHTVLALAAMLNALATFPSRTDFAEWGVIAAPRWPGRLGTAHALSRYRADGARGVSPMAIPNLCLHSLSATVSLVFAMRGPNFGVGGGLSSVADGLMAGLGVQLDCNLPGTWVVFSEWNTEPGLSACEPQACALALALGPAPSARCDKRLVMRQAAQVPATADCRLDGLIGHLLGPETTTPWTCTLDGGMELVLGGRELQL